MRPLAALCVSVLATTARADVLTGVVLDEAGMPAAGAKVTAAAIYQSPPFRSTTMADERGRFQIDLPLVKKPIHYELAIHWHTQGAEEYDAPDQNGKRVPLTGQKVSLLAIRLRTQGRLHGNLLRAEDDRPITGVQLFLDTGDVLTTDAKGSFELSGLSLHAHSLIPVAKGRVRPYVNFDTTLRPDAELELRLERAALIRGRILDEQDKPIAGAYLTRPASGTALTLNGWNELCRPDGLFEFGMAPGRVRFAFQANAPGYRADYLTWDIEAPTTGAPRIAHLSKETAPQSAANATNESDSERSSQPPTQLPRRTIEGIVSDEDGHPVKGTEVRWGASAWETAVKSDKTGGDGRYSLPGAPDSAGFLLAIADSFAPSIVPARAKQNRVDIKLSRGVKVHGVVRNTSGEPVPDVRIIATTTHLQDGLLIPIWFNERETKSDHRGEFQLTAVARGMTFDFLKDGYSELRGVQLGTGDAGNEIQLRDGGAIRGVVMDSAGKPVRNFNIRLTGPRQHENWEQICGFYAGFQWYGISFTRDDGVFVVSDVDADHWSRLIASSPKVGLAILDRVKSEPLDHLSAAEKLTIRLKPFAPMRVKVVDEASLGPIANASVALIEDRVDFTNGFNWGFDDNSAVRCQTDREGIVRFEEPAAEDGTIVVRAKGFARQRTSGAFDVPSRNIALVQAAELHGEVRLKGQLLAEGVVRLRSASNDSYAVALEDTKGRFDFDELPAGEYVLTVENKRGQAISSQKAKLESGKTQLIAVTVSNVSGSK